MLGAGTSHEGGVPLTAQILPVGWAMLASLRGPRRGRHGYLRRLDRAHEATFDRVYDFIARVFQGGASSADFDLAHAPWLDELWTLLELAAADRAAFGRGAPGDEVVAVRDALMTLMYHALVGARVRYDGADPPAKYHVEFTRRANPYAHFVAGLGEHDAVLALNYDTLLDRALARAGRAIDYGTDVTDHRRARSPRAALLKLHGSFDWLYCPSCHALQDFGGANVAHLPLEAPGRPSACPRDGSRREAVIVPPGLVKASLNPHLRRIHDAAAARLRTCTRLVFMGYAMSESDVRIRYLVKQATSLNPVLARPLRAHERPRITAVDLSHAGLAAYERLFGRGRVECVRAPFRCFVEERLHSRA